MWTHMVMRSPLLSEDPADIKQMAYDYVEARWGMRVDRAISECLAEAYLAGALDHRRAIDCAKLLAEHK